MSDLFDKYDVPSPRYTSYPTVPDWRTDGFDTDAWLERLGSALQPLAAHGDGLDLYVHLPYCESLCTFCGCTKRITRNHAVESPYVDAVLAELDLYCRALGTSPPLRSVHLGGGTPTFFSAENLQRLIGGIIARCTPAARGVRMSLEAHPGVTSKAQLQRLAELGFSRISLGVQDFDPLVQQAINRVTVPETVQRVVDEARAQGFDSVSFDLVYGLPKQTAGSVYRTTGAILSMRPERIAYYGYAHVPWIRGTGQRGFSDAEIPRGRTKHALYELARTLLLADGYVEIGLDHFARPDDELALSAAERRLNRSFMGYLPDTAAVTLGLGASSISSCGTAFAQNARKVRDYLQHIAGARLAVERGHLMSATDCVVGAHIEDLMCNLHTRWEPDAAPATDTQAIDKRLGALARDGLVEIVGNDVSVTPRGRPFLRNICMAFDQYRSPRANESGRFSQAV